MNWKMMFKGKLRPKKKFGQKYFLLKTTLELLIVKGGGGAGAY